jgi:predicted MPP superfamily phosphohydrolase
VKFPRISRRQFLATALLATPAALVADASFIEPDWLKIHRRRIGNGPPTHRLVHFTDLHHKGDRAYLQAVVTAINAQAPDCVCFTGDLLEESRFLNETLELLSGIKAPLYGVPGNHDYWSRIPFGPVQKCFAATGGAWLMNEHREIAGGKINLIGITSGPRFQPQLIRTQLVQLPSPLNPGQKNLLLMHYPAWAKNLGGQKFDLMLAGHSHGGQVRIPFFGALIIPFGVDEYDLGYFDTPAGPLYVGSGIGWFHFAIRFNCRPEITVIEI